MDITTDDSLIIFGSTSGLVMPLGSATVMPCCRKQPLRKPAGDCCDPRRLRILHASERVDNSEHRTKQSDEWCGRTNSRQPGETTLKLRGLDGNRALQSTLGGFYFIAGNIR